MFSFLVNLLALSSLNTTVDPDQSKHLLKIVSDMGFSSETHCTTTADGYILQLHRILNIDNKNLSFMPEQMASTNCLNNTSIRQPIILMPGLGCTSAAFIVGSPSVPNLNIQANQVGNNLAMVLSQADYDVWIANVRGNKFSINHVNKSAKDEKYWDYSIDQIVQYDLPNIINYVKNYTGSDTIGYVGYSQGSTIMFALLASQPDLYTPIIKPFIAMAPAVMIGSTWLDMFENIIRFGNLGSDSLTGPVFSEFSDILQPIPVDSCENFPVLCQHVIDLIFGAESKQLNSTRMGVYLSHIMTSFSYQTIRHFFQMKTAQKFQKYDYGPEENWRQYGSSKVPEYNLSKIESPNIALIYSGNDRLVTIDNIDKIKSALRVPLVDDYLVPDPNWNHLDFITGLETGRFINTRVLQILQKFPDSGCIFSNNNYNTNNFSSSSSKQ